MSPTEPSDCRTLSNQPMENVPANKAYTSLVRSILEYATQVWDPYQKSSTHKIEQTRVAKRMYPNYDYYY